MSKLACFGFISDLGNIILDIVIAIGVVICIVVMCKYEGSRKLLFYAIGVFIIGSGVFSGISLIQEMNSKSYENGQIDIENQFSQESFKYSSTSVVFYHDIYDDTNKYSFEKDLLKVNDFNGENFYYKVFLNKYQLINADIKAGSIFTTFDMDFYDSDGNIDFVGILKISIKFLSNKTQLSLETTGNESAKFFEQYFKDNGIRLKVDRIL